MLPVEYVIVSPVRDEEAHVEATLRSVCEQTHRPAEWVIVDDGSSDRTGALLDELASRHDWIDVVHRQDRGFRAAGSGVMEAFHAGLAALRSTRWQFLVKLDGDLEFGPDYFERCLREFALDPTLGIGGGVIYNELGGALVRERHPRFHVRGATKIYRRACWEAIDGLIRERGWDTQDEVKANMLGWRTRSFEGIQLVQKRFTGDAAGQWSNWKKNGAAAYLVGYHPLFLIARAVARGLRKPYLIASLGMLYGFFGALIARTPRSGDPAVIRYLRSQQLRRLVGRTSIWR